MTRMRRRSLPPRHSPLHRTHLMSLTVLTVFAFYAVPGGSNGGVVVQISSRGSPALHPRAKPLPERVSEAESGAHSVARFWIGVFPRSLSGASSSLQAFRPPLHLHACVPFLRALRGGGGKHRERRRSKSGGGASPGR